MRGFTMGGFTMGRFMVGGFTMGRFMVGGFTIGAVLSITGSEGDSKGVRAEFLSDGFLRFLK